MTFANVCNRLLTLKFNHLVKFPATGFICYRRSMKRLLVALILLFLLFDQSKWFYHDWTKGKQNGTHRKRKRNTKYKQLNLKLVYIKHSIHWTQAFIAKCSKSLHWLCCMCVFPPIGMHINSRMKWIHRKSGFFCNTTTDFIHTTIHWLLYINDKHLYKRIFLVK